LNTKEVFDKYKIFPKDRTKMNIPLVAFESMLIVRLTLKIDVLKMEKVFFTGYCESKKAFYVSSQNWKGEEEEVNNYLPTWSFLSSRKNPKLEKFL
jgi:hypothetical protein